MVQTVKCVAAATFTRFVSHHGMVHGDPDNKFAKVLDVPVEAVQNFVEAGLIKPPKGFKAEASEGEDAGAVADTSDQAPE